MATQLIKPVTRELLHTERGKVRGRKILATMMGGDVIQFRYKGTRQTFQCSLHSCLMLAKVITWDNEHSKRMEEYNRKRKAGIRTRKPSKAFIRVSPAIIKKEELEEAMRAQLMAQSIVKDSFRKSLNK